MSSSVCGERARPAGGWLSVRLGAATCAVGWKVCAVLRLAGWVGVGRRASHYVSAKAKADADGGLCVACWMYAAATGCSHARRRGDLPAKSREYHSLGTRRSHSASTVEPPWTVECAHRTAPGVADLVQEGEDLSVVGDFVRHAPALVARGLIDYIALHRTSLRSHAHSRPCRTASVRVRVWNGEPRLETTHACPPM